MSAPATQSTVPTATEKKPLKATSPVSGDTISGYSMDLTGIRGTTDRIPGGDALAMRGPWSRDADHGDDLPHPDQILREVLDRTGYRQMLSNDGTIDSGSLSARNRRKVGARAAASTWRGALA